jgi:hypothetical protein
MDHKKTISRLASALARRRSIRWVAVFVQDVRDPPPFFQRVELKIRRRRAKPMRVSRNDRMERLRVLDWAAQWRRRERIIPASPS